MILGANINDPTATRDALLGMLRGKPDLSDQVRIFGALLDQISGKPRFLWQVASRMTFKWRKHLKFRYYAKAIFQCSSDLIWMSVIAAKDMTTLFLFRSLSFLISVLSSRKQTISNTLI
jgi:hypothetical protein